MPQSLSSLMCEMRVAVDPPWWIFIECQMSDFLKSVGTVRVLESLLSDYCAAAVDDGFLKVPILLTRQPLTASVRLPWICGPSPEQRGKTILGKKTRTKYRGFKEVVPNMWDSSATVLVKTLLKLLENASCFSMASLLPAADKVQHKTNKQKADMFQLTLNYHASCSWKLPIT